MQAFETDVATGPPQRILSRGGGCSPLSPFAHRPARRGLELEPVAGSMNRNVPISRGQMLFPGLWMFIGLVSAFDTYLTVKFRESLWYEELNPMARMLLQLDDWEPSLLVGLKFLGTLISLGFVSALHWRNRRMGTIVDGGVALFQFGLLCYLVLR
jgi:hypothetical protein